MAPSPSVPAPALILCSFSYIGRVVRYEQSGSSIDVRAVPRSLEPERAKKGKVRSASPSDSRWAKCPRGKYRGRLPNKGTTQIGRDEQQKGIQT
eukprot:645873-Pleurochrysis_carterae.AAC.1